MARQREHRRLEASAAADAILRPMIAHFVAWLQRPKEERGSALRAARAAGEAVPLRPPWALGAVLAVAALLRFSLLDLGTFSAEEAGTLQLAADLLDTGRLPLTEVVSDSLGIQQFPTVTYLFALPMLLSRDPLAAMAMVAAAHVGAVWLAYRMLEEHFGPLAAFLGGLLLATNPSAILLARSANDVALHIPFVLLFLWGLLAWVARRSAAGLFWGIVGLAVALELHSAAFPLALLFALALLSRPRSVRPWPLLLGVGVALATMAPYLYHELLNGFPNLRILLTWAGRPTTYDLSGLSHLVTLISSEGVRGSLLAPWAGSAGESLALAAGAVRASDGVVLFFAAGIGLLAWQGLRRPAGARARGHLPSIVLLLAVALPIAVYARHQVPVLRHYLSGMQAPALLVAGIGAAWLLQVGVPVGFRPGARLWPRALLTGAVGAGLVAVVGSQLVAYGALLAWLDSGETTLSSGLPLRHQRQVVQRMLDLQRQHGAAGIVIGSCCEPVAFSHLLRDRARLASFRDRSAIAFPPPGSASFLYVTINDSSPAAALLRETLPDLQIDAIPVPNGSGSSYRFFVLSPQAQDLVRQRLSWSDPALQLENGLQLVGYRLPRAVAAGGTLRFALLVQLPLDLVPRDVAGHHFFYHLSDVNGVVWGESDEAAWPLLDVAPGSLMVLWRELPLERLDGPARAWLYWGMYREGDEQRWRVRQADGRFLGEAVRLGPVKVPPPPRVDLPGGAVALDGRWENGIRLRGYRWSQAGGGDGGPPALDLYWAAEAPVARDLSLFVHLLDPEGRLVAQRDGYPAGGNYPTSLWDPGEMVIDEYRFDLAPGAGPVAAVSLGWYELASMARVRLDGPAATPADHLLVPVAR